MTTFKLNGKRTQSPRIKALIEAAPGYTGAGTYDILETEDGGYRVYKIVGDKAMDASLKNLSAGDVERLNKRRNKKMGKTTLNKIQQAFDDYNKIVPADYFLQFSKAEKGFIDDYGRHPKYVASNSTWDLQFTFNSLEELKERLNAEVQDYNISQIQ